MDDAISNHQRDRLSKLSIQLSVRVCQRSLKLDEFLAWVPGTVLSFEHDSAAPLQLCIGDKILGNGAAVKIGPRAGMEIRRIGKGTEG